MQHVVDLVEKEITARPLPEKLVSDVIREMVWELVEMFYFDGFIVQQLVVDAPLKRQQKVVFLYKLKFLPRYFGFVLIAQFDVFHRKVPDGSLGKR